MENDAAESLSVTRFVLAFLAVKLASMAGAALYTYATDKEPAVSSIVITIVAVGAAMAWYAKAVNRPMSTAEIVRFSAGNVLADTGLSLAWALGMIWLLDLPFSWESAGGILGGSSDAHTAQLVWAFALVVGSAQVFLLSAAFAWSISRKLPRFGLPGETFK